MSDYTKFFRDTSPYINHHRGKTFVLALPGQAVEHDHVTAIVHDIALLNTLGIRIVLVHGARPQINRRLRERGIEETYAGALRVTDSESMACVREAMGSTRIGIESLLSMGLSNSPMHGARIRVVSGNFVTAKPLGIRDGIDYHHSGEVRKIDAAGIAAQLDLGAVVLLSALGYSPTGEAFNLTRTEVATQVAIALKADKLILFGEQAGVVEDGKLVKTIDWADIHTWLGRIDDPQLKVALEAAHQACLNRVVRTHLISYRDDGALLGELFTREGSGTLITQNSREVIRRATIDDISGILDLITPLEEQGVLVKRSRELLEAEISRFYVTVHQEGVIAACAALYPFVDSTAGELACVASHPDFSKRGLAGRLLEHLEQVARHELQLDSLFVLTTQAAHWFLENGFEAADIEQLPQTKAALYNYQRKSKIFRKLLD